MESDRCERDLIARLDELAERQLMHVNNSKIPNSSLRRVSSDDDSSEFLS